MELADPNRSYAVLIGSAAFADPALDDLPAVTNNIARLGELLTDPSVWGLPDDHCVRLPDPGSPAELLDAIHEAARKAEDTLLVYYAGHGLTDDSGLLLTLPSTDLQRPYTSVAFADVRREVLGVRGHTSRVVILDCCYSGQALTGGMGGGTNAASGTVEMAEQTRIPGTYLLTASAATRQSLAPPGEPYTAFTGELVRLLEEGLPGGDPLIEVGRMYDHLYAELQARGRPLPQQRLSNTGRTLAMARNRYRAGSRTAPSPAERAPAPEPEVDIPDELRQTLRGKPREIADAFELFWSRGDRTTTNLLLTLVVKLRPPQEVAALIVLLAPTFRNAGLHAVARRGPQAVVDCLDAFHALDGAEGNADELLRGAIGLGPQGVAATVKALRASGYPDEAARLLALETSGGRSTDDLLQVLGALWSAELDADADAVLAAAVTQSDADAIRLADALLGIGREEKAFELYAGAADAVVRQPMAELLRVLAALDAAALRSSGHPSPVHEPAREAGHEPAREAGHEPAREAGHEPAREAGHGPGHEPGQEEVEAHAGGHQHQADLLLRAAVAAAVTSHVSSLPVPYDLAGLCEALWSAGMDGRALSALARAAALLSPERTVALAETLREGGHDDGVRHLLRAAALTSPVVATPRFVDALRDMGRPVDANHLLATVSLRAAEDIVHLLAWCERHDRRRDRDRLMDAVRGSPAEVRHGLFNAVLNSSSEHDDLVDGLASAPDREFIDVLWGVRKAGNSTGLVRLLTRAVQIDPARARDRVALLGISMDSLDVEQAVLWALILTLIPDEAQRAGASSLPLPEIRFHVGHRQPLSLRVYATAALCAAGQQAAVVEALCVPEPQQLATMPIEQFVDWLAALRARGLTECVEALIRSVHPSGAYFADGLVALLSERGQYESAAYALSWYDSAPSTVFPAPSALSPPLSPPSP